MIKYIPLGDSASLLKLGNEISKEINKQIRALAFEIDKSKIKGLVEIVPAYNELMVCYNPLEIKFDLLVDKLKKIEKKMNPKDLPPPVMVNIPVCYDDEFAPDIEIVAEINKLLKEEVIKIHSSIEYLVYMLGFTPGFCYLGGMDNRIAIPRKETPRQKIEAGSVGIAGNQTGIYPIDSPGGWQLIGKTPLKLFDPERKPEFLIEARNYIRFNPITKAVFNEIRKQVEIGNYQLRKEFSNA
jgi:KipI family sensor histidine kinase inhibitor